VSSTGGTPSTSGRPPQTVAKQVRRHSAGNIALSVAILAVTLGAFLVGAILGAVFGGLASGHDSAGHAAAILIGGAAIAVLALLGTAGTILQIAGRRLAWPVALATFLVVVIGWIVVFLIVAFSLA
jgi:hypothetical protein